MSRPLIANTLAGAVIVLVAALFLCSSALANCVSASWYGTESGNRTADGSYFDGTQMIVAHRSLPFGTKLKLTRNGRVAVATVRDRGPAKWTGRDLDLSRAVAAKLGMIEAGVGIVCYERIN